MAFHIATNVTEMV